MASRLKRRIPVIFGGVGGATGSSTMAAIGRMVRGVIGAAAGTGASAAFGVAVTPASSTFGRVFYDDFSDGTTNKWGQDGTRNKGTVVTTAHDGLCPPETGGRMWQAIDNPELVSSDPACYSTLRLGTIPHTNEYLLRMRVRVPPDFPRTDPAGSSMKKIGRIFKQFTLNGSAKTHNSEWVARTAQGLGHEGHVTNSSGLGDFASYFGGFAGDTTNNGTEWNTLEIYVNYATGAFKAWNDNVLVQNYTGMPYSSVRFEPFYTTSNWATGSGSGHKLYVDRVEIYSDTGTGGTGSMSDGTAGV
jgi:hypothetical protein